MSTINRDRLPGHPRGRARRRRTARRWRCPRRCPSRRSGDALHQLGLALLAVALPLPLGRRVGQDEPGSDAVDRDAERAELVRHLPGEADLAGLGAGVGLDAGQADAAARSGGDVDDPAPAALPSSTGRPRGCTGTRCTGWRRRPLATSSSETSSIGGGSGPTTPPALLTRMSTPPTEAKNAVDLAGSLTSTVGRRVLVEPVTVAPSSRSAAAIAAPMPCAVPVTTAVLPASARGRHRSQPFSSSSRTSATPVCQISVMILVRAARRSRRSMPSAVQVATRRAGSTARPASRGMTGFGSARHVGSRHPGPREVLEPAAVASGLGS